MKTTATTTTTALAMAGISIMVGGGGGGGVSANSAVKEMEEFWVDGITVLENLEDYKAIWIKPHGCVWSECAIDDTDDGIVGDNRDGDEQWYQYRTQEFCANAAFSLYGAKKGKSALFGCTRKHFINSFFTYGGADNLLKAAGIQPVIYYNNYNNNNNNNGSNGTNADCQQMDYENGQDGGEPQRDLQEEGDRNSNGNSITSSMGCDAKGNYVIATFNSNTCDGNYYATDLDPFTEYNEQQDSIGCHRMYSARAYDDVDHSSLGYLLNNSWSCDLDLYPNGCPDPYGTKERWDFALRTIGNGGNARLAYRNMLYKRPLRITSYVLISFAFTILVIGYSIRRRARIRAAGGSYPGFFRCLWEDFVTFAKRIRIRRATKKKKKKKAKQVDVDVDAACAESCYTREESVADKDSTEKTATDKSDSSTKSDSSKKSVGVEKKDDTVMVQDETVKSTTATEETASGVLA